MLISLNNYVILDICISQLRVINFKARHQSPSTGSNDTTSAIRLTTIISLIALLIKFSNWLCISPAVPPQPPDTDSGAKTTY